MRDPKNSYEKMRNHLYNLNEIYSPSKYWEIETDSMSYIWKATDEILVKLRDHTHWITGVRSYDYKDHHMHNKGQLRRQYDFLKAKGGNLPIFGEPCILGDFGFEINGEIFNLDTLKFHESILALSLRGHLERISKLPRPIVCEIGAGWGGFAAMFLKHVPNAQYIVVDLESTLLFSGTYLPQCFPNRTIGYFGSREFTGNEDIIFLTAAQFREWHCPRIDLAVNLVSFQEMTNEQILEYSNLLLEKNTYVLYSHNKQKSRNNQELTSVNINLINWRSISEQEVLNWDYSEFSDYTLLESALKTSKLLRFLLNFVTKLMKIMPECNRKKMVSQVKLILKPSVYNEMMMRIDHRFFRDRYRHYFFYSDIGLSSERNNS